MDENKVVHQIRRSMLPVVILSQLLQGPSHGYSMLSKFDEHGITGIKSGTLYPLLRGMEEAGDIAAEWEIADRGPARKNFTITEQGQQTLQEIRLWLRQIG
ncbi:PadR family transcriptional regulator [Arthrobacter sp. MYb211]|uniref:PadR family transcriptional regulator n=1 Tax=Micrococcaceae TaxID=1268 RepID=UPI000CFC84FD|nr:MULTISPECIES: PadR family transcriptional regulator [unclassified Arthrobacter]PRA04133.1 PadR family transcriptional regulator [Arthrobacter sp. MYb229]PRA11649.1 PadR family transcriptional regulator [Arthrobacter sp. MYb221]PRB51955.1 PadR family transcriptional regulator [Arthrobacter sp. MYb216]PRC07848.1 PadR family transcriptional regulator [Arthrobacter sp. MYb211]